MLVLKVAIPLPFTVAVPSVVVPSVKITVPAMGAEPSTSLMVAVRTTAAPAMPGLGEAVRVDAVSVGVTTCVIAAEVTGP